MDTAGYTRFAAFLERQGLIKSRRRCPNTQ
jgi:hypothetical protein